MPSTKGTHRSTNDWDCNVSLCSLENEEVMTPPNSCFHH
jgi:hypothetical protein